MVFMRSRGSWQMIVVGKVHVVFVMSRSLAFDIIVGEVEDFEDIMPRTFAAPQVWNAIIIRMKTK